MNKYIIVSFISLLCIDRNSSAVQDPVFANVTLNSVVSVNPDGSFDYKYSFVNPADNTIRILNLTLDATGVADLNNGSLHNDNLYWISGVSRVRPEASWNITGKSLSQTEPGTQVNGLHLNSFALPQIRVAKIAGDLDVYFLQRGHERRIELNIPEDEEISDMAAENIITARYTLSLKTLGPLGVQPGSYAHWDQVWSDIQTAAVLGWLKNAALTNAITTHFGAARDAARAQDGVAATREIHAVLDAIQTATPDQRSDEGYALVYYNALFLANPNLYPCEPVLTLTPERVERHLGEMHTVTATLTNRVDGLPIESNRLQISVIRGPHAGQHVDSFTDTNGQLSFGYTGTLLGEDSIQAAAPPGEVVDSGVKAHMTTIRGSKPATWKATTRAHAPTQPATRFCTIYNFYSDPVKALWKDGPDLLVSLFAPPLLISAPGRTFYLTEKTANRGKIAAPATVTRYYLSPTEPIDLSTARIIGERAIPPLAPSAQSGVFEVPYTVPADLPAGTYHLSACADADMQVIETNEVNNCAHDFLESTIGIILLKPPTNRAPVANNQTLKLNGNSSRAVNLTASDEDNDLLTYKIIAGPVHGALSGTAPALSYAPATGYHGLDSFTFVANDGKADSNVATVTIRVNAVPECGKGRPSPPALAWPPNHKFRPVAITGVTDPDGDPVTLTVTTIRQDEPVKSPGSGNFSPDATISPLQLRAEREGGGDGRIYHVNFTARDNQGGSCTGTVSVCVPHDQGQPPNCVDGGPLYDSTLP